MHVILLTIGHYPNVEPIYAVEGSLYPTDPLAAYETLLE